MCRRSVLRCQLRLQDAYTTRHYVCTPLGMNIGCDDQTVWNVEEGWQDSRSRLRLNNLEVRLTE